MLGRAASALGLAMLVACVVLFVFVALAALEGGNLVGGLFYTAMAIGGCMLVAEALKDKGR